MAAPPFPYGSVACYGVIVELQNKSPEYVMEYILSERSFS